MKKLKYLIILFLLIFQISIIAQFVPIEFEDYQPKWMHYFFDSTAVGGNYKGKSDGMRHLFWDPQLIVENDSIMYILYKIVANSLSADGGFIEKLDIKNHESLWMNYFDLRNTDKFESPSFFYINEEEVLEIVGFRIKDTNVFTRKSKFFQRKYDTVTGELLEHFFSPESDTLAPWLFSDSRWHNSQLIPEKDKSYTYVSRVGYEKEGPFDFTKIIYKLNELGQLGGTTKILVDTLSKYNFIGSRFYRVDESEYFNYQYSFNVNNSYADTFYYRILFQYYDRDFVLDRQYDMTDKYRIKNGATYYIKYVDEDYIITNFWEQYEPLHWSIFFYTFDHNGNLVDSALMVTPVGERLEYLGIQRISEDEFLIAGCSQWQAKGAANKMYFFRKKIGEDLEFLKSFTITQKNHFVRAHRFAPLNNGDILYIGSHGYSQFDNTGNHLDDKGGGWNVMIYFPAEDIGLTTGTEETTQSPRMEIELYPNPASGQIELALASRVSGYVQIFDILGREVIRKTVEDQDHITVATGHLETGNYFVKLYDNKENLLGAKSFVKGR